jgi:hypothetical protein
LNVACQRTYEVTAQIGVGGAKGRVPVISNTDVRRSGCDYSGCRNVTDRFGTPYEPRLGGAATMLPEYIEKMKAMPRPAKVVTRGGEGGN